MKKSKMNAVTLRSILGTMIVVVLLLAIVGFYFEQSWLSSLAVSISHTVADSQTSNGSVQSLQKLQEDLSSQQSIIEKANNIVTSSSTFQTQAVQDLTTYANATGITISNYTFPPPTAAATSVASTLPATQVTITLASPVNYINLLKFMNAIEGNLPKMQITSIDLQQDTADPSSVEANQLTVAVYTN